MITCAHQVHIPQFSKPGSPDRHRLNWNYCDVYSGILPVSVVPPLGARIPLFGDYEMVAIVLSVDVLVPGMASSIGTEVIFASVDDMVQFSKRAEELGFSHHSTAASIHDVASSLFFKLFLPDKQREDIHLAYIS